MVCAANYLSVKRTNERLEQNGFLSEQISQRTLLQNQVTQLHEAHVSKARLLAMMSHDLRQPLHALGLMLERIRQEVPKFSERVEVDAVSDVASSLTNSLSMLMAITRLNSGDIVPLPEPVSLEQLFSSLNHEFKDTANQRALRLFFDHGNLYALTDPNLIRIILANLISNSIKYSTMGEISIRAVLQDKESVRIDVRDEGSGIGSNDVSKIFEPFVRLQLRSVESDGIGLGLAIVKQMANLIKAPLEVRSEVGVGSTFSIELPRTQQINRSDQGENRASLQGLVVVLVDNDSVVLNSTTQTLERWGCRVIAAHDWPELKAKLDRSSSPIDLILSDFHLQGDVSGYELIMRLRKRQKSEIPSILLTGDVDVRADAEAPSQGVVIAYKPLPSKRLAMLIYETTAATVTR